MHNTDLFSANNGRTLLLVADTDKITANFTSGKAKM